MATNRMQKFDELITRELSTELQQRFPDKIFSLTQVHVSKDLSFAKVWVSSIDEADKLVVYFQNYAKELRSILAKKIVARRVPSFYFVVDSTEEKAQKIEKLISSIKIDKSDK